MAINSSDCHGIIALLSVHNKNLLDWKFDRNWFVFLMCSQAYTSHACTTMTVFSSSCSKITSGLVHVEARSDITSEPLPLLYGFGWKGEPMAVLWGTGSRVLMVCFVITMNSRRYTYFCVGVGWRQGKKRSWNKICASILSWYKPCFPFLSAINLLLHWLCDAFIFF